MNNPEANINFESSKSLQESLETKVPFQDSEIRKHLSEANKGRDYSTYNWRMDAALISKAESLLPKFPDIEEGDVIVDAGSGTGMLAELIAAEYHGAKVVGLDISHELQNTARQNMSMVELAYGDASEKNFPANSIKVIYFSTSGHEVESFGGQGRMKQAIAVSFEELAPEGKILIRDFVKPSMTGDVLMQINSPAKSADTEVGGLTPDQIDYSQLSSHALLKRFHKEFGWEFDLTTETKNGQTYYKLPAEFAYEFYMRKNYTGNWRNEIKEKYSYWTKEEAVKNLEEVGFSEVEIEEERNPYMMSNWIEPEIKLFKDSDKDQLEELELFATHMVVTGTKKSATPDNDSTQIKTIDYHKLSESVKFNPDTKLITIGEKTFSTGIPVVGTKKMIYRLSEPVNGKPAILKTIKPTTLNIHNAYVAMYQSIERSNILEEYHIPSLPVLEKDEEGPPFRYYIQEAAPQNAEFLSDQLTKGELPEEIIKQLCEIVNRTELSRQWQVDTNPYNWYINEENELTYSDGKVYRYDEDWRFAKVGLLQYTNMKYLKLAKDCSPAIPNQQEYQDLVKLWQQDLPQFKYWKKYLDPEIQPK